MEPRPLADRFRLGPLIGAGAVADVLRAHDLETGIDVAVKMASNRIGRQEARLRFDREAAALAVLASPHVVELVAAGEADDGQPYLVLELLRGRTLEQHLAEAGPVAPGSLLDWFTQAAAAIELAHGVGIIHRDLKPANLFLHRGGEDDHERVVLKVLDFGLLTDVQDAQTHDAGQVVGTPLYMAPEQARGHAVRVGPATDVWALGMLAVALLTGEDYWSSTSIHDLIRDIEGAPLYAPSTRWTWLPRRFDAWFLRSVHRVPERRWRSVRQQALALAEALPLHDAPGSPRPDEARLDGRVVGRSMRAAEASTMAAPLPPPPVTAQDEASIVGRRVELASLDAMLVPGAVVTLTGPGGVGKSRIARATCTAIGERFPDGAWLVPLGAVVHPTALPEAIAQVLELEADATRPALERVTAALGPMRALVVLDGMEHLVEGTERVSEGSERVSEGRSRLAEMVARAPRVSWLITSRVPLGLRGEQAILIEPLEVPPPSVSPVEAASYAAVKLFVARAREAQPGFALTPENAAQVVALCRLVDGVPLAIELAAAQVRARPLADIGSHLEATGVRGAIAWSYGLLDAHEQRLLRQLALFPAGELLRDVKERLGHLVPDLPTALAHLVSSHLVVVVGSDPPHYTMLESVRDFCVSVGADEIANLWQAASNHLAGVAERADEGLRGREQAEWLATLDAGHDNFRAALAWSSASSPTAAMQLAGRLAWYWYLRGNYHEGLRWLESAIERAPPSHGEQRLRALSGAGRLAFLSCRYARGEELLGESSQLAMALGDRRGEADAEQILASIARERGDYITARARHLRCLALWRDLDDPREIARTRNYLTFLGWLGEDDASRVAAGEGWSERAAEEFRALGDREGLVWSLLNRGAMALYRADGETARITLARAFAESVEVRYQEGIAWALNLAGLASLARGERVQARARLRASLRVHRRLGDLWRCASVLEALAVLAVECDEASLAATLFGGAGALRRRIGAPVPRCERALTESASARGASALGAEHSAVETSGAVLSLDELMTVATGVNLR